jgi:hypothetical protein
MPIAIQCACGKSYRAPDEMAGRKIRCKACHVAIDVPRPEMDEEIASVEDYEEEDALPEAPRAARRPAAKAKTAAKAGRSESRVSAGSAHAEAEEQRGRAMSFGVQMLIGGAVVSCLPFFGFEIGNRGGGPGFGAVGTWILGGALLIIGAGCCLSSAFVTVKPARRRDDGNGETASARVVNPGEMVAKGILWIILLAMLSIPVLIIGGFALVVVVAVLGPLAWVVGPIAIGLMVLGVFYFLRRRRESQSRKR